MDVVGHDGLIRDIRAGRMPSADRVAALLDYLGVTQGPELHALAPGFAEGSTPISEHENTDKPDGFIVIKHHPEAGLVSPPPLALARSWLDDRGLDPAFLSVVTAPDDSMSPTISAFSQLLLDSRPRLGERSAIFAVADMGNLRVGRAARVSPDMITVSFDKLGTPPLVVQGRRAAVLRPLGRVVWVMRSV